MQLGLLDGRSPGEVEVPDGNGLWDATEQSHPGAAPSKQGSLWACEHQPSRQGMVPKVGMGDLWTEVTPSGRGLSGERKRKATDVGGLSIYVWRAEFLVKD